MKKKIGDLTLKELAKICHSQPENGCDRCPLQEMDICCCLFDDTLNKEIEVEE